MRISVILLLWCVCNTGASAQADLLFESNYPESASCAGLYADYTIASDAITVAFQNAYLRAGFLDTDLKDQSLARMHPQNHVGSLFNGGLYYRHRPAKMLGMDSTAWYVGLHERTHFSSRFPKDLFELYFYGNRPFEGKTADVGDFRYLHLIYQQLEFGLVRQCVRGDRTLTVAASLSLLNGQDFLEIRTGDGTLYTHTDAEYVDMRLYLEAAQSDTVDDGIGSLNGIGASLAIDARYEVAGKYAFRLAVSDFGAIAWDDASTSFQVDTSYHFEGVVVNNLFDTLYLDLKSETEFKDGFKKNREAGAFTKALPVPVSMSYHRWLSGKVVAGAGAGYVVHGNSQPLFFLSGDYRFSARTRAGLDVSYGGYAGFGVGLRFAKDLGKGFIVHAGIPYVTGYIATRSGTAQSANAGLKKVF